MGTGKLLSLVILVSATSLLVLFLALTSTSPASIGPIGVTVWFLLLLIASGSGLSLLLYLIKRQRPEQTTVSRRQQLASSIRQGSLLGGYITVILALSSLRQLDLRDAVLVAILALLMEFYFRGKK